MFAPSATSSYVALAAATSASKYCDGSVDEVSSEPRNSNGVTTQ
jgi:hypothetical protein